MKLNNSIKSLTLLLLVTFIINCTPNGIIEEVPVPFRKPFDYPRVRTMEGFTLEAITFDPMYVSKVLHEPPINTVKEGLRERVDWNNLKIDHTMPSQRAILGGADPFCGGKIKIENSGWIGFLKKTVTIIATVPNNVKYVYWILNDFDKSKISIENEKVGDIVDFPTKSEFISSHSVITPVGRDTIYITPDQKAVEIDKIHDGLVKPFILGNDQTWITLTAAAEGLSSICASIKTFDPNNNKLFAYVVWKPQPKPVFCGPNCIVNILEDSKDPFKLHQNIETINYLLRVENISDYDVRNMKVNLSLNPPDWGTLTQSQITIPFVPARSIRENRRITVKFPENRKPFSPKKIVAISGNVHYKVTSHHDHNFITEEATTIEYQPFNSGLLCTVKRINNYNVVNLSNTGEGYVYDIRINDSMITDPELENIFINSTKHLALAQGKSISKRYPAGKAEYVVKYKVAHEQEKVTRNGIEYIPFETPAGSVKLEIAQ